jgi:hypothetical protein
MAALPSILLVCMANGHDPGHVPNTSTTSRAGYIITSDGRPILLKLQGQAEISLSTLESAYSALSASMRTCVRNVLWLFLSEVIAALCLPTQSNSTICCSKSIFKWKVFGSHVSNGHASIVKIDVIEQWAG